MSKNELSVRQICIMMCIFNAAIKLMLYPTTMAAACGNALWAPVLFDTAVQTLCVWAVCIVCSRTKKTFFSLLKDAFGRTVSRIVYAVYALYFILSAVAPMTEQQAMVHEVFYDTIPSIIVFLPFFFFAAYAGSKGFANAGRTAEVCLPVFAVTTAMLVIMGLPECNFSALLPVFARPAADMFSAAAGGMFRFNGGAFMLLFMGNFSYKRGDAAKITLSSALGGLVVAVVCAIFYAVYSELAPQQYFAISKISIFFSAISLIGRTDLLAVYALDIVMLFALAVNIQAAAYCLKKVVGRDILPVYSLAVNAVLITLTFVLNNKFALVQQLAAVYMGWSTAVLSCAVPALLFVGMLVKGGARHEKV